MDLSLILALASKDKHSATPPETTLSGEMDVGLPSSEPNPEVMGDKACLLMLMHGHVLELMINE